MWEGEERMAEKGERFSESNGERSVREKSSLMTLTSMPSSVLRNGEDYRLLNGFSKLLPSLMLKFLRRLWHRRQQGKGQRSHTFGEWIGQQGWMALKDFAPPPHASLPPPGFRGGQR